jgi:NADH-quinone oxidoreductase subunit L
MTVPLQVLALGSIVVGFLGIPHVMGHPLHIPNLIEEWLHPVMAAAHQALEQVHTHPVPGAAVEWGLMAASVLLAAASIFVATKIYRDEPETAKNLAEAWPVAHRTLLNKYYVDEIYGEVFVNGLALEGGRTLHALDRFVVDGGDGEVRAGLGVNGVAWASRDLVAKLSDFLDRWVVDGLVNLVAWILDASSYAFRAVQNGLVQHYALVMLIGVFLIIGAGRLILGLY